MCGTIEELKSHSCDCPGNRKRQCTAKPQLRRQYQHCARANAPECECEDQPHPNDVGEQCAPDALLHPEKAPDESERCAKHERESPSAAVRQAPLHPAKRTRCQKEIFCLECQTESDQDR